ncbi:MAG: AMP-binding protein [Burkholderiales bacterium]|nr:AMP-binding protein [Burkholderiales bacterium]
MSDALSIRAAAGQAGASPALVVGGRSYTYAQLAALVEDALPELAHARGHGAAFPLVADNALATAVTLLALLELRLPALLLHPRLTAEERGAYVADARRAARDVHPDAAVVIHTSGTTGRPRGAVLTRAALAASAAASAANLGWQADDRWLACMPIARVGGLSILTRCLAARRTAVLAPGFDAATLPATLADARVTLVSLVPTMLARLLDAHPGWRPPAHLRAILVGGAAAPEPLLRRAAERGVPIVLTYGMTETCSQVVATPYAERFAPAACGTGRVLPPAQLRVVAGRIEVRGPMLMAGYLGAPPLPPEAWFDTGDLGAVDARGCVTVHARRTDLIVTGGENVYPAEVERALERCPGVAAAAVFGVPDDAWGEIVAAALVVAPDGAPHDDALGAWLRARLAPHKRPRRVCRVLHLPQTAAGKLDRDGLAALAPLLRPLDAES